MGGVVISVVGASVLVVFGLVLWRRADAGGKNNGPGQSRLAAVTLFVGAAVVVVLAVLSAAG